MWSYPYYGVPVYGTGWYYPPYFGRYYYPRPPTWGFHVGYNPWTGWNFGMSWSNGFMSMGISWGGGYGGAYRPWGCCGGWYGGGYRGPTVINTGDINIGNSVNIGNRNTISNRIDRGDTNINLNNTRNNIYNRPENRTRNADRATVRNDLKQARPAANRQNDVFADRDGNVARRANDKWETREGGEWKPDQRPEKLPEQRPEKLPEQRPSVTPETRDRARGAASSRDIDRSSLDRSNRARQHGAAREQRRPAAADATPLAPATQRRDVFLPGGPKRRGLAEASAVSSKRAKSAVELTLASEPWRRYGGLPL